MIGKNYKWRLVARLRFVCLFNSADRQAIFPIFPLLKFGVAKFVRPERTLQEVRLQA